jgi:DNA-binding winged helix-turn-helix (wHTH) protein/Tol biopolymer transport system component
VKCYTDAVTGETLAPVNGSSTIRFSVFELDLKAGELRGNGSKIRLQEQPFKILVSLLEHPGEVVTREELRSKLWPADTFVDFDHSLNAAIRRLRDALGDSADRPRFVETVARRGYRFIAPVTHPTTAAFESTAAAQRSNQEPAPTSLRETGPSATVISEHRKHKWQFGIAITAVLIAVTLIGLHVVQPSAVRPGLSQRRLTANRPELPVLNATLSPSGKYLAFADPTGLYLRQVDSGETHPISLPSGFVANPLSWFPDDNHLLVSTHPSTSAASSLWRISVMGGQPQLLTDNGSSAVASQDGSQIAFVRGPISSQEIWLMQADGGKATRLLGCNGCFLGGLAWSPDGRQVAYVKQQHQMGTSFWGFDTQLEILNLASNRSELLESHVGPALVWTPDERIIYVRGELPPNQSDSNLWAVRVNARTMRPEGAPERITNGNGLIAGVSASADRRKLAILRRTLQPNVYVAQLQDHGTRLSTPRLLTPDEWYDFPTAWTADSKSVLFFSDRDGVFHIFKQAINETQPQLLVGGNEAAALPRLNPDSSMVLYVKSRSDVGILREPQSPHTDAALGIQQLMRIPVTGGPSQLVLEGRGINNLQCAKLPYTLCIYSELAPGEEHFYAFDPLKGKGKEIPGAAIHVSDLYSFNWSLSPDGKLLALSEKFGIQGQPAIRLFSLVDATERRISLPGWAGIATLDWSADGKSLWSTAFTTSETTSGLWTTGFNATGEWTLLKVELSGKVTPMLRESKMNLGWAIPSPDGSMLAIWKAAGSSNVWLAETR